jgi:hypothetical protein
LLEYILNISNTYSFKPYYYNCLFAFCFHCDLFRHQTNETVLHEMLPQNLFEYCNNNNLFREVLVEGRDDADDVVDTKISIDNDNTTGTAAVINDKGKYYDHDDPSSKRPTKTAMTTKTKVTTKALTTKRAKTNKSPLAVPLPLPPPYQSKSPPKQPIPNSPQHHRPPPSSSLQQQHQYNHQSYFSKYSSDSSHHPPPHHYPPPPNYHHHNNSNDQHHPYAPPRTSASEDSGDGIRRSHHQPPPHQPPPLPPSSGGYDYYAMSSPSLPHAGPSSIIPSNNMAMTPTNSSPRKYLPPRYHPSPLHYYPPY